MHTPACKQYVDVKLRGTDLVGFDGSHFFILLNPVSNLFLPRLERAFRDGLGHLWHFDRLICAVDERRVKCESTGVGRTESMRRMERSVSRECRPPASAHTVSADNYMRRTRSKAHWDSARAVTSCRRHTGVMRRVHIVAKGEQLTNDADGIGTFPPGRAAANGAFSSANHGHRSHD